MRYIKFAIKLVAKLAIIGIAFIVLIGGPAYLISRLLPTFQTEAYLLLALIVPWSWCVNRFVLSPLEFRLGIRSRQYDPWYQNHVHDRRPARNTASRRQRSRVQSVFFECSRHGRQPLYLVIAVAMGSFALWLLVISLVNEARNPTPFGQCDVLSLVCSVIWLSGMFGMSGVLIWQFWKKRSVVYRIDKDGIITPSQNWRWKDVRWIALRPEGSTSEAVYIVFGVRGWLSWDRMLPSYPPILRQDADEAMEQIVTYLGKHHPEVKVA